MEIRSVKGMSCTAMIAAFLVVGCAMPEKSDNLKKKIVGEWRNIYLRIAINEMDGKDSVRVAEFDSTNWEAMLKIKPIRTFFNADGSYRSDYYNLNDSLFRTSSGTWSVMGDTLIMNETKPARGQYKMKTTIQSGVATFDGMLDFDKDGQEDDHYLGRQRKQ